MGTCKKITKLESRKLGYQDKKTGRLVSGPFDATVLCFSSSF